MTRALALLYLAVRLLFLLLLLAAVIWGILSVADAHDWSRPDLAQLNQYQKNWMQKQRRPGTNTLCCSEADGDVVDEEIRYDEKGVGRYWINSAKTRGAWIVVPDAAVIREPNLHGRPIAWFRWVSADGKIASEVPRDDLDVVVFCYMPGPLS